MRLLQDGDRVDVFARVLEDGDSGERFIVPWTPGQSSAYRQRTAAHAGAPFSPVPVSGWPTGPVDVDDADWRLAWRIEGTWRAGTVELGSRTLTEHPRAKLFHQGPSPLAARPNSWYSPLDATQQAVLEQQRAEGLVVASWPIKKLDGNVVLSIVTSDPPAVRDALQLRPDQQVSVDPSPWTAATVEDTYAAISRHVEEWHVFSTGKGKGTGDRPVVLTASVAWLEPESLTFYESTPPGLLELDVWLSPAAGQ